MKNFAISITAYKNYYGLISIGSNLMIEKLNSALEAKGYGQQVLEDKYPKKEGWEYTEVMVIECPPA